MSRDETMTDAERGAESTPSPVESAPPASESKTKKKRGGRKKAATVHSSDSKTNEKRGGGEKAATVHWLARVAERAGLEGKRPDVAPSAEAKDAWPAVTRAYKIEDAELCELVATYFRLEVADFQARDPNALLLVPEALARRHHV